MASGFADASKVALNLRAHIFFSELPRSHAGVFGKDPAHVQGTGKADQCGQFIDFLIRFKKQPF